MRTGAVLASDITVQGFRLTGGFHLAEDQHAMRLLSRVHSSDHLINLTQGRRIIRGPIFKRIFAQSEAYGRPYVSAKDLNKSDIVSPEFLSYRHGTLLNELELREGMILVTCSGMNLGRAIWTRCDMQGLCASHDLIRIEPDPNQAPPGYLYAFLASHFGHVAIRQQIYGGSIKHIEPQHIAKLAVPRFGNAFELKVHALVEEASAARSRAAELRRNAFEAFRTYFQLEDLTSAPTSVHYATFAVQSSQLRRLDAAFFSPASLVAARDLAASCRSVQKLRNVARVFTPGIFKRIHVEDPKHGYAYFAGSELFKYDAEPRGHLSRLAPSIREYLVKKDWLLIQDAGQLDGLIGRLIRVGPQVAGGVVSNNLIRIATSSSADAGYLSVVLSSPHGYRAITRNAFGSSIPHLDAKHIGELDVPWPEETIRKRLAAPMLETWDLEDLAMFAECKAKQLVEEAIGGGT